MIRAFFLGMVGMLVAGAQSSPTGPAKQWWSHVEVLADDKMEGRDTGSDGYRRAARYVVEQFERAELKPAGENSGYYQRVPLREVQVTKSAIEIVDGDKRTPLRLNEDIGVTPRVGLPEKVDAPLVFAGSESGDYSGKVAVILAGVERPALSNAAGVITIDNPRGLEAPRWPIAYARGMSVEGGTPRNPPGPGLTMRLNPQVAGVLFEGTGHAFAELVELAVQHKPLPAFPLNRRLNAAVTVESRVTESDNIIAVLPGSDLASEYVVVSAHLDGYGFGTPVNGDRIYNGAFDDAACVADLIELAKHFHQGKKPRRSIVFAVFTGEEKGLLGSQYFTTHFTIPKQQIVADINLDYIRPIFPLRILTTLGLAVSTLGDAARSAGEELGIRIQPDNEPERGLFRRSDQYNFIRAGIPGIAFIFGYENGSPEEATYRQWYRDHYHRPSDDLKQPVNFDAAMKFYNFFQLLTERVANSDESPRMNPGAKL